MTLDYPSSFIDPIHTLSTNLVSLSDDGGTADVTFAEHGVGVEPFAAGEPAVHLQSEEEKILQGWESFNRELSSLQCKFCLFDTRLELLEHQLASLGIL